MRTTLDIDDDLLRTAQELARQQGVSAGKVVSRLLRAALLSPVSNESNAVSRSGKQGLSRLGFRIHQNGRAMVTNDEVNRLREQEGI